MRVTYVERGRRYNAVTDEEVGPASARELLVSVLTYLKRRRRARRFAGLLRRER